MEQEVERMQLSLFENLLCNFHQVVPKEAFVTQKRGKTSQELKLMINTGSPVTSFNFAKSSCTTRLFFEEMVAVAEGS